MSVFVRLKCHLLSLTACKGFILEASALPRHPATSLLPIDGPNKPLAITLDHQTKEEIEVNGRDPLIRYRTSFPRYPFLLMIDAIVSPDSFQLSKSY